MTETMINGNLEAMFRNVEQVSREQVCNGSTVLPYVACSGIVISGTIPYSRTNGPGGGLCLDIKMDTLKQHVEKIKFEGQGVGFIMNPATDIIITSADVISSKYS